MEKLKNWWILTEALRQKLEYFDVETDVTHLGDLQNKEYRSNVQIKQGNGNN